MKFGYIYKIIYLDEKSHLYKHYYYGMRKCCKNESLFDSNDKTYYHGCSARANREYWPFYNKHKKEILCWCDNINELRQKEEEIISLHINEPLCINIVKGGNGNPYIGKSDELYNDWKHRISETLKQTYNDHPEILENLSKKRKGRKVWSIGTKFTNEHKNHISESKKEYFKDQDNRKKHSNILKGRTAWNKGQKRQYAWMNDTIEEQLVYKDYWGEYIDIGFTFGKIKGKYTAWNKGLKLK